MKKKKVFSSFLSFMLVMTLVFSLAVPAQAAELYPNASVINSSIEESSPVSTEEDSISVPTEEDSTSVSAETPRPRRKAGSTKLVKSAIRYALRHSDDVIEAAAKYFDDDVAKIISKKFATAAPVLNKLLAYDSLVWESVQDALTPIVGSQAAVWIRYVLEFAL